MDLVPKAALKSGHPYRLYECPLCGGRTAISNPIETPTFKSLIGEKRSPHPREIAANHQRMALAARPCPHNFHRFLCLPALAGERDLLRWHDLGCLGEGLLTGRSLRCRRLTHGQNLNRVADLEWPGQSVKIRADGELTGGSQYTPQRNRSGPGELRRRLHRMRILASLLSTDPRVVGIGCEGTWNGASLR